MPSATRSGPLTSTQPNNPALNPNPTTTETEGYNTRKKLYKYSHTRAPFVPPPPRPAKRQAPPISVASKRQRVDTDSTEGQTLAVNTNANMDENLGPFNYENTIENIRTSTTENPNVNANANILGSSGFQPNMPNPAGGTATSNQTTPPSGITINQISGINPQQRPVAQSQTRPNNSHAEASTSLTPGVPTSATQPCGTSASSLHFTTPRRPAREMGVSTPTLIVFQTPPAWARFNETEPDFSQFPPGAAALFTQTSARIEDIDPLDVPHQVHPISSNRSTSISRQDQLVGDFDSAARSKNLEISSAIQTSHPNPYSPARLDSHYSDLPVSTSTSTNYPTPSQSTALVIRTPTSDFSQMYNTIKQTLRPVIPLTFRNSSSNATVQTLHTGAPQAFHVESTVGSNATPSLPDVSAAASRTGSISRASSLTVDNWGSREGSISRNSPAPTMVGSSRDRSSSSNNDADNRSQRSLRQQDFTFEQVLFINAIKKRWHWYLIAEDLFPINTTQALEVCTRYAEQSLDSSRRQCDIRHRALEFVRRKDSSIRSLFQAGLLSIIEESYGVNTGTIDKLNELTKKVAGRYRHPCLMRVVGAILFTKRKDGHSIGSCFMPVIMGGNHSTNIPEQPEGCGITVPMIALACTLVFYGLQSIRAGDSSQRNGNHQEKPINFTEKRYSPHYRSFTAKLQGYNRLEEVRRAYLEEIMKEYLKIHAKDMEDLDGSMEIEDEMHSDGD